MSIPKWMLEIKVGDVLINRRGDPRIVRYVSDKKRSVSSSYVGFAIKRCSWTGRCYTLYAFNDLRTLGYLPTSHHVKLNKPLDKQIESEITRGANKADLTCCDVDGLP